MMSEDSNAILTKRYLGATDMETDNKLPNLSCTEPLHDVIVSRLWELYAWPEWNLPMRRMTPEKLLRYRAQSKYVSDLERTRKQPSRAWDYGRIRFFYEQLLAGQALDAILVDNHCDGGHIYPEPVLLDGHHRLAAAHLARARTLRVSYGGRLDLLRYLTGQRKMCPTVPL